ncbi:MAG TPA: helix-turn-helix domain-containing protein [Chromatiaceae bacterium]|nr:helix-turn-helix domain-containing protein [Chromatiaceae bacterium]
MKQDARSLPAAAKGEKRKQAVRLCIRGDTYAAIAGLVGVHERTVIR